MNGLIHVTQRRTQIPVRHLKWSFLRKELSALRNTVNGISSWKYLTASSLVYIYLRCLTGLNTPLWHNIQVIKYNTMFPWIVSHVRNQYPSSISKILSWTLSSSLSSPLSHKLLLSQPSPRQYLHADTHDLNCYFSMNISAMCNILSLFPSNDILARL